MQRPIVKRVLGGIRGKQLSLAKPMEFAESGVLRSECAVNLSLECTKLLQEEIHNSEEVSDTTIATVLNLAYVEVSLLRLYLECARAC